MSNSTRVTPSAKPLPFFTLNASYRIEPGEKPANLATDACCLLEACLAAVQTVIEGLGDEDSQMAANPRDAISLLFGVRYQLEMVQNIAGALQYPGAQS